MPEKRPKNEDQSLLLLQRLVMINEGILEKLEEIRYATIDNETGLSNLLKQAKLANGKLEELVDKRH